MPLKVLVFSAVSLSSLLLAFLSAAAWMRGRFVRRAGAFAGLCLSGLLYSVCYILELLSPDLPSALMAIRVEYIGIALIAPFLILVTRDFADDGKSRVPAPLLFAIPAAIIALAFTTPLPSLLYVDPRVERVEGLTILHFEGGPGYWLHNAYLTLAIAHAVFVFFRFSVSGPHTKRIQARFMLLGSFFPWIGSLAYLAGLIPYGLDPSPMSLSITGTFFGIGFFRYRLFDIRPIARDTVFEQMRDAVLVTDDLGTIIDYNEAARGLFPLLSEIGRIRNIRELAAGSASFLEATTKEPVDCIVSLPLPQGDRRFALHHSVLSDRRGRVQGLARVLMDVTERVCLEERLSTLASTDELTGVANRRCFLERAREELERARRYGRPFGVAILDLNDFKGINDTFGHPAGDEALRLAAGLCAETLRTADIMGRYGGDEFAFAFPECDERGALEAAERISRIVASAAFPYGDKLIQLSASVGAAGYSSPPLPELEDLLKLADERMYKQKGRRNSAKRSDARAAENQ